MNFEVMIGIMWAVQKGALCFHSSVLKPFKPLHFRLIQLGLHFYL